MDPWGPETDNVHKKCENLIQNVDISSSNVLTFYQQLRHLGQKLRHWGINLDIGGNNFDIGGKHFDIGAKTSTSWQKL